MDIHTLAEQEPRNIDDALDCMEMGLRFFHEAHDRRAIFLRLYHKMTLEVHAAINGCGDYEGRDVFMEPGWVRRLSGHFSTLYFKSLKAPATERAWTLAYASAPDEERKRIVYNKLEWQSHRLAERLSRTHWMWRAERALNAVIVPFRRRARWAATPIEERCRDDHQEVGRPLSEIGS